MPQLVARLQLKGLIVADTSMAERILRSIGYFRFRGFALPFTTPAPPGFAHGNRIFSPGTTFEQICEIYDFDRELRALILEQLERIEIAARTAIIDVLNSKLGCHWYSDFTKPIFSAPDHHSKWFNDVCRELQRSKEPFVLHYFNNYDSPTLPPSWTIAECLTFGKWSHLYERIAHGKATIAKVFGLTPPVLQSWLHTLTYVRNLCAHHSRIHKRPFPFPPKTHPNYSSEFSASPQTSFYLRALTIQIMISSIDSNVRFRDGLRYLEYSYGTSLLQDAGFPAGWASLPVWK